MWPEIRSEIRKLLTVRSTYGIVAFALVLEGIFAFWANGVKVDHEALKSPFFLQSQMIEGISALGLIGAFVGILLITHEYRYNTIMYSLTTTNKRYKVLLAKAIVITLYSIVFTTVMAVLTPLLVRLGVAIQGADMVHQQLAYSEFVWHLLFYGWSFAMAGLVIGFVVRNQIVAFASLLLLPGLAEQLLGLVLKENAKYLPFTALDSVIHSAPRMTPGEGALVWGIYLVIAWLVAVVLFQKRDAN